MANLNMIIAMMVSVIMVMHAGASRSDSPRRKLLAGFTCTTTAQCQAITTSPYNIMTLNANNGGSYSPSLCSCSPAKTPTNDPPCPAGKCYCNQNLKLNCGEGQTACKLDFNGTVTTCTTIPATHCLYTGLNIKAVKQIDGEVQFFTTTDCAASSLFPNTGFLAVVSKAGTGSCLDTLVAPYKKEISHVSVCFTTPPPVSCGCTASVGTNASCSTVEKSFTNATVSACDVALTNATVSACDVALTNATVTAATVDFQQASCSQCTATPNNDSSYTCPDGYTAKCIPDTLVAPTARPGTCTPSGGALTQATCSAVQGVLTQATCTPTGGALTQATCTPTGGALTQATCSCSGGQVTQGTCVPQQTCS